MKLERKPRSAADQAQADKDAYIKNILNKKDFRDNPIYNYSEATQMYQAEEKVKKNENFKDFSTYTNFKELLIESGCWTYFKTRPFNRSPKIDSNPVDPNNEFSKSVFLLSMSIGE